MIKAVLVIDPDNSKMKSKYTKEGQTLFGKTLLNILKSTLKASFEIIDHKLIEGDTLFVMGNAPLLETDSIKAAIRQYPDDVVFFKDRKEAPIALYLPEKIYERNEDVLASDWGTFSNLVESLAIAYRVETLKHCTVVFTKHDVLKASKRAQRFINNKHIENGVTFVDPEKTYVDFDVKIGMDTVLFTNTFITGDTEIGEECVIGPDARINDSKIGDETTIKDSTVLESKIANNTTVGPYAYIRPNSDIGSNVKVGDFVEIKNATIGNGTKMSHLAYVGDADLGENINVSCGVIFSNYNGKEKARCTIGNDSFIGCNVNLIAPVELEALSYVAAGTTVTKTVPSGALAVGRARQENKEGWVKRKGFIKEK